MDLAHFIIATFCLVDDLMVDILGHRRLRQWGPRPAAHRQRGPHHVIPIQNGYAT